jgi:hypothetical protein
VISESTSSREAALAGRLTFLNAGTGTAAINIYDGTRPADGDAAATGTLLASVELQAPAGVVAGGALTLACEPANLILASGVATWARVVTRSGASAFDMDVGLSGSGAECTLPSTTLYAGGDVTVLSAVLG